MKHAMHLKLLREARITLPRTRAAILAGAAPNICAHLSAARNAFYHFHDRDEVHHAWYALSERIEELLGPDVVLLEHWLSRHGYITQKQADDLLQPKATVPASVFVKVQNTRLAWIDHLIEEYSK